MPWCQYSGDTNVHQRAAQHSTRSSQDCPKVLSQYMEVLLADRDVLLFANEAFYRAFTDRDMDAMARIWASEAPVCCIHPGWEAIRVRDNILGSWRSILSNPGSPAIRCRAADVVTWGDVNAVVCFEQIGQSFLIATNLFVHEAGSWRMVLHHASPTSAVPPKEEGAGAIN